jgi:membrane-associated phospholipid phosphatase
MRAHIIFNASPGKLIAALFVFTLLFHGSSSAEVPDQPANQTQQIIQRESEPVKASPVKLNKEYFAGYWTDTKNIVTAPARWDSSDWIEASIVTGIAVGLFTQDDNIRRWVQKHKNTTTGNISDDAKKIGTFSVPAVVGLGLYGYIAGDGKAKTTFLLSTESFIVTGAFVQILKRTTGRHRPSTGDSHDTWSGPGISGQNDHLSFPSGDASSAFAIASVVASEYNNVVVPSLVYSVSTLIALSRVHNNGHWSSDAFVGSAIGYFTGKAIVASHRDGKESNLSIAPVIDGKDLGFVVTYRY